MGLIGMFLSLSQRKVSPLLQVGGIYPLIIYLDCSVDTDALVLRRAGDFYWSKRKKKRNFRFLETMSLGYFSLKNSYI